ncbi:MAG: aminopeptidase P family protein [Anaerolinea sp.]|nr:aminopeptidase P family protein [Anaerolinea sp.]
MKISAEEHRQRCEKLLMHLHVQGLNGVVLSDPQYILYYTGFAFIPTERPILFVMNKRGDRALFVPRLEKEHAESNALIDRVDFYIEYPYTPHPMAAFQTMLDELDVKAPVGTDEDGYPWIFGYRGPRLSEMLGAPYTNIRAFIEDALMIKSAAEIRLLREACVWANLAHTLLQRCTKVGLTETEVSQRASDEATRVMLDTIGPIYRGQSPYYGGAIAGYRGQIGRNAAIPHALANNLTFQAGDVLVTGAAAPVWGYHSELERTMVIGRATDQQKFLFEHMLALQTLAINALEPGKPCAEIDKEVRAYYEHHDLMQFWKHHVGHAIGLRYHEAPFLDVGDLTELQPGMVFTVEPGLYAPGIGGFRHSDTVLITADGVEVLTYYPRDLESLTLPV